MSETFRKARADDLPRMIALLADDPLGAGRESRDPDGAAPYLRAFAAIDSDPDELLLVAEVDGEVQGLLQLSFLHGLSRGGALRAQIEGVRVAEAMRGAGLGRRMFTHAIGLARTRGCALVQLTSDTSRTGAHGFYDSLGFTASHVGYKLAL